MCVYHKQRANIVRTSTVNMVLNLWLRCERCGFKSQLVPGDTFWDMLKICFCPVMLNHTGRRAWWVWGCSKYLHEHVLLQKTTNYRISMFQFADMLGFWIVPLQLILDYDRTVIQMLTRGPLTFDLRTGVKQFNRRFYFYHNIFIFTQMSVLWPQNFWQHWRKRIKQNFIVIPAHLYSSGWSGFEATNMYDERESEIRNQELTAPRCVSHLVWV